jgi:HEAT repeat protein
LKALEQLGDDAAGAVPALVEALKQPEARKLAAEVLLGLGEKAKDAAAALEQCLGDPDPDFRETAAAALWHVAKRPRAIATMIDSLSRHDVVDTAVSDLADVGADAKAAVPALLALLKNDDDSQLQLNVADALWAIDEHPAAEQTLLDALQDPSRRVDAAELLWNANQHPAALPTLVDVLLSPPGADDDPDQGADRAAEVLAKIGEGAKEIVPLLARSLGEYDKDTRHRILQTIARIDPEAAEKIQNGELPPDVQPGAWDRAARSRIKI